MSKVKERKIYNQKFKLMINKNNILNNKYLIIKNKKFL